MLSWLSQVWVIHNQDLPIIYLCVFVQDSPQFNTKTCQICVVLLNFVINSKTYDECANKTQSLTCGPVMIIIVSNTARCYLSTHTTAYILYTTASTLRLDNMSLPVATTSLIKWRYKILFITSMPHIALLQTSWMGHISLQVICGTHYHIYMSP